MKPQVVIHGVKELNAAFDDVATKVDPELGKALRTVAKPVKDTAQSLSGQAIGGGPWSRARIKRKKLTVYVAPTQRGTKVPWRKRPNLNTLLMTRAYLPALKQHQGAIERGVSKVIDDLCKSVD